ncbi:DNA translocase FtsK [Halomonas dongshanensis]|uniref:DNA translocase FtsK n=1 Tax=Halomonas dongshanensis TaxID=2890835 RepID=UPI00249F4A83|nr:DNA translocase FtsK 4TM domain-containing protein [Halomonas dongshanensis]
MKVNKAVDKRTQRNTRQTAKDASSARVKAAKDKARRFGLRLQGSTREGVVVVLLALCVFLLLALLSYHPADPGWSYQGPETDVRNWMGPVGAWLADVLYSLLGASALWWPGMLGFAAWWLIRSRQVRFEIDPVAIAVHIGGLVLLIFGTTMLGALHFYHANSMLPYASGGILGEGLVRSLMPLVNSGGVGLIAAALILSGFPLFSGLSWLQVADELGRRLCRLGGWMRYRRMRRDEKTAQRAARKPTPVAEKPSAARSPRRGERREPEFSEDTSIPWEAAFSGAVADDALTAQTPAAVAPKREPAPAPVLSPKAEPAPPATPEPKAPEIKAPEPEPAPELKAFEPTAPAVKPAARVEPAFEPEAHTAPEAAQDEPDDTPMPLYARRFEENEEPESQTLANGDDDIANSEVKAPSKPQPLTEAYPPVEAQPTAEVPTSKPQSADDVYENEVQEEEEREEEDFTPLMPLHARRDEREEESAFSAASLRATDREGGDGSGDETDAPRAPIAPAAVTAATVAPRVAEVVPEPVWEDDDEVDLTPAPRVAPSVEPARPTARHEPTFDADEAAQEADDGPTLWTVEHLQSQRPTLENLPEPEGEVPSLRLLTPPEPHQPNYTDEQLADMAELLEVRLREYGVKAEVVDTWPGPVITRFEIKPAAGVKVSKISNLAKDLARSLMVKSVRVVEVIPGRPTVGIEIPNPHRAMIRLREVIDSDRFQNEASPLTLALGQDIGGSPVVANLGKMPHLLVAGTTGSGKSVGVNAMLISMLLKAKPNELKLIMVDPKMLELSVYDGIPHLLAPVVTDMKEAANSLRWCVAEMERRYKLMAAMGVRNIAGFNARLDEAERAGAQVADPLWEPQPWEMHQTPPVLEKLPYIVVVIDEFADMFMIVGKKVEELIARLAQKARAAGIHLILATQRPSVDVVTGLIKANIPSRMAFQVSSRIDSRTILDQGGAESLLGHGDMLYLPAGSGPPNRVHGAFVDDDEVHRVVDDWKRRGAPEYIEEILSGGVTADALAGLEAEGGDGDDAEQDALYDEAVQFVTESRKASISAVQRRFKIGYNRAARLVEAMESAGVVSSMSSNGSRDVLAHPPG